MARVGGATSKLDGLNEMQRAFASNYAASFNGAQAAIAAGYAKKSAEVQAYRLLRNDKIQAYLRSLQRSAR